MGIGVGLLIAGVVVALVLGEALDITPFPARPAATPDGDIPLAWLARILLALTLAWIVIGMFASRTSLIRRPGAAAARASWIGATRPWRARESTLGMLPLDRWLLLLVPGALLGATRAVQTSFSAPLHLLVVLLGWIAFAVVLRVVLGSRSPWPVLAAVAGVVVLRSALTLLALSFAGPGGSEGAFWSDPLLRGLYIALAVALYVWMLVAAVWALTSSPRRRRVDAG